MKFMPGWREIRNSRSFVFSLDLALGLIGFAVVDAFRPGFERVTSESKSY